MKVADVWAWGLSVALVVIGLMQVYWTALDGEALGSAGLILLNGMLTLYAAQQGYRIWVRQVQRGEDPIRRGVSLILANLLAAYASLYVIMLVWPGWTPILLRSIFRTNFLGLMLVVISIQTTRLLELGDDEGG